MRDSHVGGPLLACKRTPLYRLDPAAFFFAAGAFFFAAGAFLALAAPFPFAFLPFPFPFFAATVFGPCLLHCPVWRKARVHKNDLMQCVSLLLLHGPPRPPWRTEER